MTDATSTRYQMLELVLPRLDNTIRESPYCFGSFRRRILRASVGEFALHAHTMHTTPISIDVDGCGCLIRPRNMPHLFEGRLRREHPTVDACLENIPDASRWRACRSLESCRRHEDLAAASDVNLLDFTERRRLDTTPLAAVADC